MPPPRRHPADAYHRPDLRQALIDQALRLVKESVRVRTREAEGIPEHYHLRPATAFEGGVRAVPDHAIRHGARTPHAEIGPGEEGEHRPGDVQRHSSGSHSPHEGEESSRSGTEVEDPSFLDRMAEEKPFSKFAVEVSLSRSLVPQPFPARQPIRSWGRVRRPMR